MLSCCNGKHIAKAQLTVRKAGETALEYMIIKFEDLLVASVSTGGSGGEDRLTENVTLNFAKVNVEYTQQDQKGGAGAKPKMGWDIPGNAKI
jgi:type VI secretion system secreted protein Hcp